MNASLDFVSLFLRAIHCMNLDKYYILYVLKVGEVAGQIVVVCVGMHCLIWTFQQEFIDVCFSCRSFRSWSLSTWRRSSRRISSSRTSGLWSLTLEWVCTGTLRASSCSAWTRPDGPPDSSGVCLCKCLHTAHASRIQPRSFCPHHTTQRAAASAPSPAALNSGMGTIWGFSHRSDVAKTLRFIVIIIRLFACFCLWVTWGKWVKPKDFQTDSEHKSHFDPIRNDS